MSLFTLNSTQTGAFDLWDYFDASALNTSEGVGAAVEGADVGGGGEARGGALVPQPENEFVVAMYSVLLTVGAVGNVLVFIALIRSRRRKSRVNLMMTHLAVADMIVTFIVIPLEIGWRTTNAWVAGNIACKLFLVLRAFGLYLSSNVLVCISIDRFFAVLYPLRVSVARQRSKYMLYAAWGCALACSMPQGVVFRVLRHPLDPTFEQCVSFDAFASEWREVAYNLFCLCAVYFVPLLLITCCYVCIFCEIATNSKELSGDSTAPTAESDSSRVLLRRSDRSLLERARSRTLRMTVTIVSVFASCWLPYVTMTMWYMLDRQSASHVPKRVQDLFFIMAVSNSCMNPLVYGSYSPGCRPALRAALRRACCAGCALGDGLRAKQIEKQMKSANKTCNTSQKTGGSRARCHDWSISSSAAAHSEPLPIRPAGHACDKPFRSCDVIDAYLAVD